MITLRMTLQVNSAPGQYVRPKMSERGPLCIVEGRHPLMEQLQGSDDFVPNDTYLAGVAIPGASVHAFAPHACPDSTQMARSWCCCRERLIAVTRSDLCQDSIGRLWRVPCENMSSCRPRAEELSVLNALSSCGPHAELLNVLNALS
jgi:hypothetical protein